MIGRSLVREISVALVIKVAALATLFVLFFSPDKRVDVTTETFSQVLMGPHMERTEPQ